MLVFYWFMLGLLVTIKMADWGCIWLQAKARERGLGLRPKLNAGPVCDTQAAFAACSAIKF